MNANTNNTSIGEILSEDYMKPNNLSAYKLAHDINVPVSRIQDILHDRRRLSVDTALRLAKYFDLAEKYFINLQDDIDIREAKLKYSEEINNITPQRSRSGKQSMHDIYVQNEYGTFSIETIITDFKDHLYSSINRDAVKSMTLFGSYAKGTQKKESDIDICIVFDDKAITESNINLCVADASNEMIDLYGVDIQALCFREDYYSQNRNTSLLFKDIEREGIAC